MPEPSERAAILHRECRVFCRLLGRTASPYVRSRYEDWHRVVGGTPSGPFDRFALAVARLGTPAARVVDVYTTLLAPGALVRRKLVVVLALLECSPADFAALDRPTSSSRALVWLRLVAAALAWGFLLLVGLVLLGPIHAVASLVSSSGSASGEGATP